LGTLAIACATGGFKGVFLHGVLSAFESAGLRADAYGAASSSVPPAAAAAIGQANDLGLAFWEQGRQLLQQPGKGMSHMVLTGISQNGPSIRSQLFRPGMPRFLIATSAVGPAAAEVTQGKGARRQGRKLLLAAARGDRSWVDEHLSPQIFDTAAADEKLRLTAESFDEMAYASSRMLHAWDIPAWVNGRPYVDAFYTCACPAVELAALGYDKVIALATEPVLYRDIFQDQIIPLQAGGTAIQVIAPDGDPADRGVDYTSANEVGLNAVYEHGRQKAQAFLATLFC